ncbi:MAG: DUF2079 domain-containing protein [Ruminococcus sp.]|nr:DUF2079 domain-containing protein [Ruminococcus sp.]
MNENTKISLNDIIEKLSQHHLTLERIIAAFFSSFMLSYIFQMYKNPVFYELDSYYNSINFALFFGVAIVFGIFLCFLTYMYRMPSLIPRITILLTTILNFQFASKGGNPDVYFLIGLSVVDLVVVLWCVKDDKLNLSRIYIGYKTCFLFACALFLVTSIYFSYITSLKYQNFSNTTFDFGIFAQMFEGMATTGAPLTTVERSVEMSHFGVHLSPFFYLLLPGYMIFRSPIYLICSQSIFVALGVFPVYLICKKLGLSGKVTMAFEFIYVFYPCLFNGCFYDFHENKFLTTIILFLFYFLLSDKTYATFITSVLLLSVKEDAAIYLIVIAIYTIINKNKKLLGGIMLAMAVVYFIAAQKIIASLGTEGIMIGRLGDYFINDEEGFFSVFKSIFFDMGYLIKMMFTPEKFPFIVWMFLPLMFTPFMHKKISALILILPIIPINLMQSWPYQYNVDYQYTYGVAAMLIFLAILGIKNLSGNIRRVALLMSIILCFTATSMILSNKVSGNLTLERNYGDKTEAIENILRSIPKDKSVTADNSIMPHLYYVKEIYSVPDYYKEVEQTDYFVLYHKHPEYVEEMKQVMGDDYTLVRKSSDVEIYQHK